MARDKSENKGYADLKQDLKDGSIRQIYAFYGEERYLLEHYLGQIRKKLIDDGFREFNYRKLSGKNITVNDIVAAVDMLPVFAERTLIEIDDYDIFKLPEADKTAVLDLFADIPEYVCLIFIYDTIEYKADNRIKLNQEIRKIWNEVEFAGQKQSDLIDWITRRFKALGKRISKAEADYLIFVSGGLMTKLVTEIEKIAAYSKEPNITQKDIDAVVIPVVEAMAYKMTNAVIDGKFNDALKVLSDLYALQEPPHKIIYGLSQRMRQLYSAWLLLESRRGEAELAEMFAIKNEYVSRGIMRNARRAGGHWCKEGLIKCTEAAMKLNYSTGIDNNEILCQLLLSLAVSE